MNTSQYSLSEQANLLNTYITFLNSGYNEQLIIDFLCVSKLIKRQHIDEVKHLLISGEQLSVVFSYLRFHKEVQAYITHGEQVGDIVAAMNLALLWIRNNLKIRKSLKQALTYPLVLIMMSVLSFIFVAFFLFPQMESFLSGYQINEKPFIFTALELLMFGIGCIFMFAVVCVSLLAAMRLLSGEQQLWIYFNIPVVRYYLQQILQIQIANRLSLYLANGYPCLAAFRHISENRRSSMLQTQVTEIDKLLTAGHTLEEAFEISDYYSDEFLLVLSFALKNNTLGTECALYSKRASEHIVIKVIKGLNLLQTLLTCIIALFLVLTYIAVFLPMLSVFETL
ncbi:type II secretion system F family protein [Culicoidibacter larvae]|uniref:Type II secretion system protein GspF domain-containing protein n=1 Tax=Culicoidibacter larvae TaxID=2579976 RepID=A0A5R8QFD7_9FIRM|nr:type II secretion system F family protein [Culicoidibacter larvae]TLG76514.1 hypothetical protein FEZ08_02555 [Culicoidibacter larvae]